MKPLYQRLSFLITALLLSATSTKAQDNSLLYKISGDDIKPSYLFGTIHVLPSKDFNLEQKVEDAFEASELIVLELDMDDPTMQMEMMKLSTMAGDVTLDQLFSEEDYQKLDEALKEATQASMGMSVGVAPFNKMKPFVVSTMLMMKYLEGQPASFEGTFVEMAKASEKEIIGLETVEEQMAIFDSVSYESQAKEIVNYLNEGDKMKDIFQKMVSTYNSDTPSDLYDMFGEYYEQDAEMMTIMLDERNKNWISRMPEIAKEQATFFGVGAGHLFGEMGVVNLLREAGYTVEAVN